MSKGGVICLPHNRKSINDTHKSYVFRIPETNVRRNCSVKNVHLWWEVGIQWETWGRRDCCVSFSIE